MLYHSEVSCPYMSKVRASVTALARLAFAEDIPAGDVTAEAMELKGRTGRARLITREPVPMCGTAWFDSVVKAYRAHVPGAALEVGHGAVDGTRLAPGSELFTLEGDVAAIVGIERVLLNFVGRGVGVARKTASFVDKVRRRGVSTRILDTRKTIPGFRYLDKYAVLCGGGYNHRLNLSDQVLIKENHLARFGGVRKAVEHVRKVIGNRVGIQIEVVDFAQLREAIDVGCPIIMLDNFTPRQVHEACELPRGDCLLEVSGGITLDNIETYLHPRLDRISIGALTHSVTTPDLSLLIEE